MNLSNELKVGLVVALAGIIFFFGLRYFQDLPLFSGSYALETQFEDSGGLAPSNPVLMSGVRIGAVDGVRLDPETQRVNVRFHVDEDIPIPQGSHAEVSGLSALGGVQLTVVPGPPSNPPLEAGTRVPSQSAPDVLSQLQAEAPQLVGRADTVLANAGTALGATERLLSDPNSDLRQTLLALRNTSRTLEQTLRREQGRLGLILENTESLTGDLSDFTDEGNLDTLGAAIASLNRTLERVNSNLDGLEATTERLSAITAKIDRGEGTLGRLVNDEELYVQLDSAAAKMNRLLADVQDNPERYLRELRLIDLF